MYPPPTPGAMTRRINQKKVPKAALSPLGALKKHCR